MLVAETREYAVSDNVDALAKVTAGAPEVANATVTLLFLAVILKPLTVLAVVEINTSEPTPTVLEAPPKEAVVETASVSKSNLVVPNETPGPTLATVFEGETNLVTITVPETVLASES